MNLTTQQKTEIVTSVISALQNNARSIDQLTLHEDIQPTDSIEISNGGRMLVQTLMEKIAPLVDISYPVLDQIVQTAIGPYPKNKGTVAQRLDDLEDDSRTVNTRVAQHLADFGDMRDLGDTTITMSIRNLQLKLSDILSKVLGVSDPAKYSGDKLVEKVSSLNDELVGLGVIARNAASTSSTALNNSSTALTVANTAKSKAEANAQTIESMQWDVELLQQNQGSPILPFYGFGEAGGAAVSFVGPAPHVVFNAELGFFYIETVFGDFFNWWGNAQLYGESYLVPGEYGEDCVGVKPATGRYFFNVTTAELYESYKDADSDVVKLRCLSSINARWSSKLQTTSFVHEISETMLYSLKQGGQLAPGQWYRITDYCMTLKSDAHPHFRSAGHQFDILVMATSESTLCEECIALPHEGDTYFANCKMSAWRIWYTMENVNCMASNLRPANRGFIYRMIDEHGNDAPIDFKNWQMKVFKGTSTDSTANNIIAVSQTDYNKYCVHNSTYGLPGASIDNTDFKWAYLFSCESLPTDDSFVDGSVSTQLFKRNVFENFSLPEAPFFDILIFGSAENCTFSGYIGSIYLRNPILVKLRDCIEFAVTYGAVSSDFINCVCCAFGMVERSTIRECMECSAYSVYDSQIHINKNGQLRVSTIIASTLSGLLNIKAGSLDMCDLNGYTIGGLKIEAGNSLSLKADGMSYIKVGNNCGFLDLGTTGCETMGTAESPNISIGNGVSNLKLFDGCDKITIGNNCEGVTIGAGCHDITLGNNCSFNTLGAGCHDLTLGENSRKNVIGANVSGTMGLVSSLNSIGANVILEVGNGFICNVVGSWCGTPNDDGSSNVDTGVFTSAVIPEGAKLTAGHCVMYNTIAPDNFGVTFGGMCFLNKIGAPQEGANITTAGAITFGDDCYSNEVGDYWRSVTFADKTFGNKIGRYCKNINIPTNWIFNRIGDWCENIGAGSDSHVLMCEFEDGVSFVSLTTSRQRTPTSAVFERFVDSYSSRKVFQTTFSQFIQFITVKKHLCLAGANSSGENMNIITLPFTTKAYNVNIISTSTGASFGIATYHKAFTDWGEEIPLTTEEAEAEAQNADASAAPAMALMSASNDNAPGVMMLSDDAEAEADEADCTPTSGIPLMIRQRMLATGLITEEEIDNIEQANNEEREVGDAE